MFQAISKKLHTRKAGVVFALFLVILFAWPSLFRSFEIFLANTFPSDTIFIAEAVNVENGFQELHEVREWTQVIQVRFVTGERSGEEETVRNKGLLTDDPGRKIKTGEFVLLVRNDDFEGDPYYMIDRYRLPVLALLFTFFLFCVLFFAGKRGAWSLVGLAASIGVLFSFIIPQILSGADPFFVSFVGAVFIAIISLYLAHGLNRSTTVALFGTLITLFIATSLAFIFTHYAHLLGFSGEESFYLQLQVATISLKGVLLAGIVIGMLGVLDDITVSQSVIVAELKKANPNFGFHELYGRGTRVGKEHIASLVNTLVLAYAGASFSLFLLLTVQGQTTPLWLAMNGEVIAEEIVRTLVGSLALVFAVPITTFLAAYYYGEIEGKHLK